jgi:hypothetical protein
MATQYEDEEKLRAQWQQEVTFKQQLQVTQEDKATFQVRKSCVLPFLQPLCCPTYSPCIAGIG